MIRNISRYVALLSFVFFLMSAHDVTAATLRINPGTGVYSVGNTFTLTVIVNTEGKPINASDGQLFFNPRELQVINVSRNASIFNLWTEEPTFSNSMGTISFSGGSPTGYTGSTGNIITISFRTLSAGTPKITFKSGSILAADGMGTNILTAMTGGTYTVSAPSETPEPEYIAPANTPKAPLITSQTHPDISLWYKEKTAELSWNLPSDVTSVRMLLDNREATIPTKVYDERLISKTIENLDEGISYFHLQFKNADGWGKISHFAIHVDSQAPASFTIHEATTTDSILGKVLQFTYDDVSPITAYKIQIDGSEQITYIDEKHTNQYVLGTLTPGHHTIVVEAIDSAQNSSVANHSFLVEAFEKPVFTDYPERINTDVIPAIKGTTRPNAHVAIEVKRMSDNTVFQSADANGGQDSFEILSNDKGEFIYIPKNNFEVGVYQITALAKDDTGLLSERSDAITIIVEVPGYIALGSKMINLLSIIVPLLALVFFLIVGTWYFWFRFIRWRKKIQKETKEVEDKLAFEFHEIMVNLDAKVDELLISRKGKLTKAEQALIAQIQTDVRKAQAKIKAEVDDIQEIIE